MADASDARALADAVNGGKQALGALDGGAFLLNEFGQVLVPAADFEATRVAVVGEWSGPFVFNNPFEPETTFDLAADDGLQCGDPWERPYVGIPHNLSRTDELYFKLVRNDGTDWLKPPVQDLDLIAALRSLRPWRAVRFIVTVGGLVVTKVEVAPEVWEPHYVGQIDPDRWFDKEP
jgi:hypothetical protein